MAKKHRGHDEAAWRNAKTICRLNARQVEMARALGMNPRKLPGLRPSAQQRWKLPVGAFIEQCYRKRFGGHPQDPERAEPEPRSRERWPLERSVRAPRCSADPVQRTLPQRLSHLGGYGIAGRYQCLNPMTLRR